MRPPDMSQTMSSPSDWAQFYQQATQDQVSSRAFGDQASDVATVVTSPIPSTAAPAPLGSTSSGGHLSPEGRVGKPVRRRSRASRRTPTTLLNTDTTNFRAMVQQFTGGPSAPFAAGGHPGGQSFGFSFGGRQLPHVNPAGSLAVPPSSGFQLQYQPQLHHHHQSTQGGYMFPLNSNNNPVGGGGRANMEAAEGAGFAVEGGVSSHLPASRSTPPASSNENRSNATTFMF